MKHTPEALSAAVSQSKSIAQVLKCLGLRPAGGTHAYISKRIKSFGLDTSHFLGQAANQGENHRGGNEKRTPDKILVLRTTGKREAAHRLRRALVEAGVPYACAGECGNDGTWRGKPMTLQVEHKNRNWLDDRQENLEFLCPNCHSQTEGWCNRKS